MRSVIGVVDTSDNLNVIREGILRDMSEGVLTLGLDGIITSVNPSAEKILGYSADELVGKSFARCFFAHSENDAFNQAILDAVYHPGISYRSIVPYYTGERIRQLNVTTSYLREDTEKIGLIAVLDDVSELIELRDELGAMEKIRALNEKLEMRNRLLSETFGRFLSDEIVQQLLDTPDGLAPGGRKRHVSILMSDLRGFTALSERLDPQELIALLNHYLAEMTVIIEKRGGTIIEFLGDGILAVFGAPGESNSHADDAVAAAVEMVSRMPEVNRWNSENGFPDLEMGIGVNSGEVIVGNIGSERRMKYGIIGSHVNLCGRIESYTVGGQVLISPATRALVTAPLTVEYEAEVLPKGVREPLVISLVTSVGAPYNVSYTTDVVEWKMLPEPVEIEFFHITDKHCESNSHRGRIVAMGNTGALLQTEESVEPYEDLKLNAMGNLFCKVLLQREFGYAIRFTSKPARFREWLNASGVAFDSEKERIGEALPEERLGES